MLQTLENYVNKYFNIVRKQVYFILYTDIFRHIHDVRGQIRYHQYVKSESYYLINHILQVDLITLNSIIIQGEKQY